MTSPVLSPNTQNSADGIVKQSMGYVTTDAGTPENQTFTVGFQPRKVRWINITDRITDEWYDGMAAASAVHTVAAGTRTLVTTGGITVNVTTSTTPTGANSFTVPAALVPASKTFAWECYG